MSRYNNTILAIVAIALSLSLVFAENLIPAYAFSVTYFASGVASITSIAWKDGETNFGVGSATADTVTVRNQNTNALVGTVASITDPAFGFTVATQANRAYFIGGASGNTVYEIDLVNAVLLRSASNGCSAVTQGVAVDSTNGNLYCALATEVVNRFSISSFTVTFSSTTLNAGATPCDTIEALSYNSATDTLFAGCAVGANNIVAVIGLTTSGTPDFSIAYSTTISGMAFNNRESNVAVCASGAVTPRIYNYSASTGFALFIAIGTTSDTCSANEYGGRMVYDRQSDRFFQAGSGNTQVRIFDATNGDNLISTVITNNVGMIIPVSNTELVGTAGTGNYFVMDLTGIPLGSNGETPSGGGGSGIDCTLPENEFILICRLGSDGSLVGAGQFIVGNVNGTTGLTPIICATGIVDCVANPDMKTNGVGYLLVTIALAIIIGILWVASRGDLTSIPTFIWFIATLAVVGAFTLMDLIDATFLVITAIIVVALAAAKVRGLFGGEFR